KQPERQNNKSSLHRLTKPVLVAEILQFSRPPVTAIASLDLRPPDRYGSLAHLNAAFIHQSSIVFATRLIGNEFLIDHSANGVLPISFTHVMEKIHTVARLHRDLLPANFHLSKDNHSTHLRRDDDPGLAANGFATLDRRNDFC